MFMQIPPRVAPPRPSRPKTTTQASAGLGGRAGARPWAGRGLEPRVGALAAAHGDRQHQARSHDEHSRTHLKKQNISHVKKGRAAPGEGRGGG